MEIFTWTADRVTLLKTRWKNGFSALQIAIELDAGCTRSAVLGKIHRLGLSGRARGRPSSLSAQPKPAAKRLELQPEDVRSLPNALLKELRGKAVVIERARRQKPAWTPPKPPPEINPDGIPPLSADDAAREPSSGCTIFELTNDRCRWPIGNPGQPSFFFCGFSGADLASNIPYCGVHRCRAWAPAAVKRAEYRSFK